MFKLNSGQRPEVGAELGSNCYESGPHGGQMRGLVNHTSQDGLERQKEETNRRSRSTMQRHEALSAIARTFLLSAIAKTFLLQRRSYA